MKRASITPPTTVTPPNVPSSSTPEEMTKALLASLRINQPVSTATPPTSGAVVAHTQDLLKRQQPAEDISRSLLNLLHASAAAKSSEGKPPDVLATLFEAAARSPQTDKAGSVRGLSVSELEAGMKVEASAKATAEAADNLKEECCTASPVITTTHIHVFRPPFDGSIPLCGLELRVEPKGYRVIRVTERPGQKGNLLEGDLILAIEDQPLANLSEQDMRRVFGSNLNDGAKVSIERIGGSTQLHPEDTDSVERKIDFGLVLSGAGVEWKNLVSKLPQVVNQAKLISDAFGVEGRLLSSDADFANREEETIVTGGAPLLILRGPAAMVDKAMRQFCIQIVKGAIQQNLVTAKQ